ncbi:tail fiber assembly protein [Cupriavidus campinensis]|uniref:Tail fiber assembly protein n=1 Tax=Cupriavidus campinensis TaxID=151783 RepID=A0AAE9HYK3_9BURK|nr:tail fiber assembly protein [Cupriavidus campinensis]URF02960.1 tail fiber assembly protein [Cupriavidus campinensis]URF05496.1 tail fiber assembly protein [Cupriavidus campinensis]
MNIHNYHPRTGEYLGAGLADDNPLDQENPIVPGFATPSEPPSASGRVAVYLDAAGRAPQNWPDGTWTLVPDYRAVSLFRTADGSVFELGDEYNGLGDLPAFLTDEARPGPAYKWVADEWVLDEQLETQQLTAQALAQRDALLAEADRLIAPLMDGFVLDELTPDDEVRLKALSQYRKALRAVNGQAGFPRTINWPVKPA